MYPKHIPLYTSGDCGARCVASKEGGRQVSGPRMPFVLLSSWLYKEVSFAIAQLFVALSKPSPCESLGDIQGPDIAELTSLLRVGWTMGRDKTPNKINQENIQ